MPSMVISWLCTSISSVPLGCALQTDPLRFGPRPRIITLSTYPLAAHYNLQPSLSCLIQEPPNLRLLQPTRAKECHIDPPDSHSHPKVRGIPKPPTAAMSQTSFQQSIAAVAQAPGQFYQTAKANGLMKRTSIFSRPGSRNGATIDQDTIDLDPSRPTLRSVATCQAGPRPSTSTDIMERSQTDPTLSKRSSLFGSRKRLNRKTTRDENGLNAEEAPRHFKSDEDCM